MGDTKNRVSNKIVKRIYCFLELELASPLNVSSGENILTDMDVLRDAEGNPFIPGTSVAGAFRGYQKEKEDRDNLFGYSDGNTGRMSPVYVSDIYFTGTVNPAIRDGISLNEGRQVQNKFDCEILETGVQGILRLEFVIRERDSEETIRRGIKTAIAGLGEGEIRFGAKKTRGFGKINVRRVCEKEFQREQLAEWLKFQAGGQKADDGAWQDYQEWKENVSLSKQFLTITVPLIQEGGISIRRYSAKPNEADFEHITCNGQPVIPGSSWNGIFRSAARELLTELKCRKMTAQINKWFGFVEGKNACQSQVVFSESILRNADAIPMTRNRISRFDASTEEGALYTEIAYFNGTTDLNISNRKKENDQALAGLVLLLIRDLQNGYLAVGGQTAVGRGIFRRNGAVRFSETDLEEKDCMQALCHLLEDKTEEVRV